ncbi:MAG: hypothetical protein EHM61_28600, partial [Acidobacteria bacterium]
MQQYRKTSPPRHAVIRLLAVVWAVCVIAQQASWTGAGTGSWSTIGGGGREVMAFAVAPDQSGVIYLVSKVLNKAVFHRSDDWGRTWKRVGVTLDCFDGLHSLAVDPRNHSIVYGFAEDCGFIKTIDGGETWTTSLLGLYGSLVIDPWRPDRILILDSATGARLSTDGGSSWGATPIFPGSMTGFVFDTKDSNRVYAANNEAVFESTDQGHAWRSITGSLKDSSGNKIKNFSGVVVDPKNAGTLYTWTWVALYKTTDGGVRWVEQSTFEKMGFEPLRLLTSSRDGTRLYAISQGKGVFTSGDSGKTWDSINLNLPFVQPRGLSVIEGEPDGLWVATTRGLFSKPAGPSLWQAHNRGLSSESRVLGLSKADPQRLYSQSSGDFYRTPDGGATWFPIRFPGLVTCVVTHPSDPLKAWLVLGVGPPDNVRTEVHETTDGGINWTRVDPGGLPSYWSYMIGDRTDPRILYLTGFGSLLKSADEGRSWTRLQPQSTGTILIQDASAKAALYVSANEGLLRSTDQGQTWDNLGDELPPRRLAIDPRHPEVLYSVTSYSQVNRSTDGGKSWLVMREGFGYSTILDILVDPVMDGVLYAADDGPGICVSQDGGRTWAPFEPEFPPPNLPLEFLLAPGGRLYVSTMGDIRHIDLGSHLDIIFPQVGDGEVPGNGRLQTTLQLVNQGPDTEAVVRFFDSFGQPLSIGLGSAPAASDHRISLGRGHSFSAVTPGRGQLQSGYARVSGGPGLTGAAVYSYSEKGITLFQAGVPSSHRINNFGLFFDVSAS